MTDDSLTISRVACPITAPITTSITTSIPIAIAQPAPNVLPELLVQRPELARVFVVHEPLSRRIDPTTGETDWVRTRDISAARSFGELRHVFPAGRLTAEPTALVSTARDKLRTFTEHDYLLPSGDPVAIAIASVAAARNLRADEALRLLVWDKRRCCYFVVETFPNISDLPALVS